ncbi:MAG: DUF721 domain-containing protein [Acidimicrobiia bacterium]|nr:DUF721 domain-containing protein [Acidimicrobiia bacterium]
MNGRRRDEPRPLGDALAAVARDLGVGDPRVLGALHSRWADLVGDQLASHARPRSLLDGVLTIEVHDPAWATQVRYLGETLRERAVDILGEGSVRSVRVVVARRGATTEQ